MVLTEDTSSFIVGDRVYVDGIKPGRIQYIGMLYVLFSSNHNIHKSFWASDPLIDRLYWNLSIKGSTAQKQRPNKGFYEQSNHAIS